MTKKKNAKQLNQIDMGEALGWKLGHGGRRVGSGRPKGTIETKVMRIPVDLVAQVEQLVNEYKRELSND